MSRALFPKPLLYGSPPLLMLSHSVLGMMVACCRKGGLSPSWMGFKIGSTNPQETLSVFQTPGPFLICPERELMGNLSSLFTTRGPWKLESECFWWALLNTQVTDTEICLSLWLLPCPCLHILLCDNEGIASSREKTREQTDNEDAAGATQHSCFGL